jgi:segregation and condensation protein A
MAATEDYKVELDVFEGPLDLLLYLIRKDEVDIYNIPVELITKQYMSHLNVMKMLDLNIAGEFLVMAATLMMIKSRMLLPVDERPEDEEDEDDPRWELVKQLVEYKKYKDMANQLQERELYQENVFDFGGENALAPDPDDSVSLQDVGLFDLIEAFNDVLDKAPPETIGEIEGDQFTVSDKIESVLTTVHDNTETSFSTLFQPRATRGEIICTFLALLELLRLRQINIFQKVQFGEIYISKNDDPDAEPVPTPAEKIQRGQLDLGALATPVESEAEHAGS